MKKRCPICFSLSSRFTLKAWRNESAADKLKHIGHRCQTHFEIPKRSRNMKYMMLMSFPKEAFEWYSKWSKEDLKKNIDFMRNFNKELKESGVLVATAGL